MPRQAEPLDTVASLHFGLGLTFPFLPFSNAQLVVYIAIAVESSALGHLRH